MFTPKLYPYPKRKMKKIERNDDIIGDVIGKEERHKKKKFVEMGWKRKMAVNESKPKQIGLNT